jgi:polyribonucleotide nucleotidyltransferase
MIKKVEVDFHGRPLSIEVGRMAKQADGAALVRYGETVVLVTAVAAKDLKLDTDFFPLTVDYQEKTFAAGKIPGGFFKREGRPSEKEILTCRLIDRSIRPLFAEGLRCETQVIATVLSADRENDPDVVAMLGTSIALHVSDIPFNGPLAGVRIGRIDGRWVMNPTQSQLEQSDVDIFLPVAGMRSSWSRAVRKWCLRKRFSKLCLPAMKRFNHSCKYKRKFAGRSANRKGMCRSPNWTTRLRAGSRIWRLPG